MYLSESERKDIMAAYGYEKAIHKDYCQVEPDTWVYLFENENKKYVLIVTDYLGSFEFEDFPHLLKFENDEFAKIVFVLRREIPVRDDSQKEKISHTVLFEYTD